MGQGWIDHEHWEKCRRLKLWPAHRPLNDSHHTDVPLTEEDEDIGCALAYFIGGLFIDIQEDRDYMFSKMTSVDAWSRVARALRIHGLKIVTAPPISERSAG